MLAIERLERIDADFDKESEGIYVQLIKEYVRRAKDYVRENGLENRTGVLIDPAPDQSLDGIVKNRIETWIQTRPTYPPHVRTLAYYFVKTENGSDANKLLEPLVQLLELGGEFYIENGFFFVGNVPVKSHLFP